MNHEYSPIPEEEPTTLDHDETRQYIGRVSLGGEVEAATSEHEQVGTEYDLAGFLEARSIKVGDSVTGLTGRELRQVEKRICSLLQPGYKPDRLMHGQKFYGEHLDDELRPKGFNGKLMNATVTFQELGTTFRTPQRSYNEGYEVAVSALAKPSGKEPMEVSRTISYTRTSVTIKSGNHGDPLGGILRRVHSDLTAKKIDKAAQQQKADSARNAIEIEQRNLQSPMSAGLPTIRKKY